ncbi:MAG: hypothetical protein WBF99_04165 [Xanthobacteraceae bacterium]
MKKPTPKPRLQGFRVRRSDVMTDWGDARHEEDAPHRYIVKDQLPKERKLEDLLIAVAKQLFSQPSDDEPLPNMYPAGERSIETFFNESLPLEAAVKAAEGGNIEPLRKLCPPPFDRFLAAPKIDGRKRVRATIKGKPNVKQDAILKAAAANVPRIATILAEMFEGKRGRVGERNPSAREVAAAIWGANPDKLNDHMNKPGRSTKPHKRKVAE